MRHILIALIALVFANPVLAQSPGLLGSLFGQSGGSQPQPSPLPLIKPTPSLGKVELPAPASPQESVSEIRPGPQQSAVSTANRNSQVFGASLFTGAFARQGPTQFNPDYLMAIGDSVRLRLWGSAIFDNVLMVDPQGNIFIPAVGPVKILGVRNQDLESVIEKAVHRVYRANVYSYASLSEAQPVRVYVGGFVNRPGLYNGTSMDSLLHYLDQAGGIDLERGSFLNIQVKRGAQIRTNMNLYDFLLEGKIPQVQLADGDIIFVSPRQKTVTVSGLAENAKRFEFSGAELNGADLIKLAKPFPLATHVRVTRNTGTIRNLEYYPLDQAGSLQLIDGDELAFTADKRPGTITVRVEGEHQSSQEHQLPYGTRIGELLKRIEYSDRSDVANLQLFRLSVKDRQKQVLQTSLKSLEAAALTARSGTNDESILRANEASLILQWVERAKEIEPSGQVQIAQASLRDELLLENGDTVRVPVKDGLVLVGGEVMFPNTLPFESELSAHDYIERAGGFTQNADASKVIIAHRDGSFVESTEGFFSRAPKVRPGDHILVLPKIDVKSRQIAKEMTTMLFQLALMAGVVFRMF
ncbi:MAG: polysaccharide export protein [Nitrospira sp. CG24C]|jgi:protein involved in polysaccharide export with SLBB domain|nr:MAG: polysaccharide export protein [Nitrospira sp. CG24C]